MHANLLPSFTINAIGQFADQCWAIKRDRCFVYKIKHVRYTSDKQLLIYPYMSYCWEIWGNTYRLNSENSLLQKKLMRIINFFTAQKILKIQDLITHKMWYDYTL